VLARGILPALNGTLAGVAALALQEQLHSVSPTKATDRSAVNCHSLTTSGV
jgi:hypothetical protein